MGNKLFPKGMPAPAVIWDQIQLAQLSTTVYAMLPVLGEFFIEEGYTRYLTHADTHIFRSYCCNHVYRDLDVRLGR